MVKVALNQRRPEKLVATKANVPFDVELDGTGTTGYEWVIDIQPADAVEVIASGFRPDFKNLGSMGRQVMRMRALRGGPSTVVFKMKRPWESEPIGQQRMLRLDVKL
jgi:predicted secreted protein